MMARRTLTLGGTSVAIYKNAVIDFHKIAVEMRSVVEGWYNAQVEVIDTNLREQTWDMATNTYGATTETIVWSGKARIQPVRSSSTPQLEVTQGSIQGVMVQVPYDATLGLVRKGMQVRVTSGGEDAVLEDLILVVRSAINSSYGWNRTIECDADVKSPA